MLCKTPVKWFVLFLSFFLIEVRVVANEIPGKPAHEHKTPTETTTGAHGDSKEPISHPHDKWVSPPPEYADARSARWDDVAAINRGKEIFENYCLSCHGADGLGTGPDAKGLSHPPADLTHHFHNKPGDGDAYLFWRVSEGGTAEPFQSMNSAMPAFATELTEDQRWDVLAYVHNRFHHGFKIEKLHP
ncbi:MAG: cytochrome c [Desulfosalsimonadaceae bacterium]